MKLTASEYLIGQIKALRRLLARPNNTDQDKTDIERKLQEVSDLLARVQTSTLTIEEAQLLEEKAMNYHYRVSSPNNPFRWRRVKGARRAGKPPSRESRN